MIDITKLPPLPKVIDLPPRDVPAPGVTDPLEVMQSNLRFWINHGQNLSARMSAIAGDPLRAGELDDLARQYLTCRDKAQTIACDLAPFRYPKMSSATYAPSPKPAASNAIPDDMSAVDAAEIYRRVIKGVR
jgi:hypothetical protein